MTSEKQQQYQNRSKMMSVSTNEIDAFLSNEQLFEEITKTPVSDEKRFRLRWNFIENVRKHRASLATQKADALNRRHDAILDIQQKGLAMRRAIFEQVQHRQNSQFVVQQRKRLNERKIMEASWKGMLSRHHTNLISLLTAQEHKQRAIGRDAMWCQNTVMRTCTSENAPADKRNKVNENAGDELENLINGESENSESEIASDHSSLKKSDTFSSNQKHSLTRVDSNISVTSIAKEKSVLEKEKLQLKKKQYLEKKTIALTTFAARQSSVFEKKKQQIKGAPSGNDSGSLESRTTSILSSSLDFLYPKERKMLQSLDSKLKIRRLKQRHLYSAARVYIRLSDWLKRNKEQSYPQQQHHHHYAIGSTTHRKEVTTRLPSLFDKNN